MITKCIFYFYYFINTREERFLLLKRELEERIKKKKKKTHTHTHNIKNDKTNLISLTLTILYNFQFYNSQRNSSKDNYIRFIIFKFMEQSIWKMRAKPKHRLYACVFLLNIKKPYKRFDLF